jgi:hypothetical protein
MSVRQRRLAAATLLALALVAACANDGSGDVDSGSNGTGPVVAHPDKGDGSGTDALIEGPLTLSDLGTELAEPLADCPTNKYGEVAMFNAGEQITVSK